MPTSVMTSDNPDPGYIVIRGRHLNYSRMITTIKEARRVFEIGLKDAHDLVRCCFSGEDVLIPWADASTLGDQFLSKLEERNKIINENLKALDDEKITIADLHRVIERYIEQKNIN